MYQALYRKWRPRIFDDVVGQEWVTQTLKNQISSNRTTHAYLFIGVRGTGKTSCAKILARALNCENPVNGNPCNKCASCVGIESGGVMDVVEIDAASNNGVDNVRALRDEAVYSPASVKKRVYIIDEVHMLSPSAFNALLKILEEPPEHLVFILATTEVQKVLPTIMSRCQRYSFKRIPQEKIAERLSFVAKQESIDLTPDAAMLLARLADGALRDALSLLDQCSGLERVTSETVLAAVGLAGGFQIGKLTQHIAAGETSKAIELFDELRIDGKAPATIMGEISALLRDVMLLSVAPKGGRELLSGGFDDETLNSLSGKIRPVEAMEYITLLQDSIGKLRDGRDPRTEAEICIISMSSPQLMDTPERLSLRISRLEKQLEDGTLNFTKQADATSTMEGNAAARVSPPSEPTALLPHNDEAFAVSEEPIGGLEKFGEPPTSDMQEEPKNVPEESEEQPPFDLPEEPVQFAVEPELSPLNIQEEASDLEPSKPKNEPESTPFSAIPVDGENIWPALCAEISRNLRPFRRPCLAGASMRRDGNWLVILAKDEFFCKELDSPEFHEIISKAIVTVTGAPSPHKIEVGTASPNAETLDTLAQFGNVKFE